MSGGSLLSNNTRLRKKIIPDEPKSDRREKNLSIKKVAEILKKREEERTTEENEILSQSSDLAQEAATRLKKREELKQREIEFEDTEQQLDEKCARLAEAIAHAQYLVVYTGAGISTAARIPDYRGTSGIWTLLQQGKDIGEHDLTQAEPTYTHMALAEMHHQGRVKHIVSQNCDGLHLRSGLPRAALSEVHGNMYIEVCRSCRPYREYLRLFDVTECTARFNHRTQRRCYRCGSPLSDSIVHFGERGSLPWPLNWKGACRAAEKADVILCMGSSLKVLKKYPWLWSMDKPVKRRPKLYIVNLQWTPKDCNAAIKIHGKCDAVMKRLAKFLRLEVPVYKKEKDPIFIHATHLCPAEQHTTTRRPLEPPEESKEEVIVITVDHDPPACCENFPRLETHDQTCQNFVDPSHDVPVIMSPDYMVPQQFTIMEAMFFHYLYTLISSLTAYQQPQPIPVPSTSSIDADSDADDEPLAKRVKIEPPVKCSFCSKQYQAEVCLFYVKHEAGFKEDSQPCLCCGEEEEPESDANDEKAKEEEENQEDDERREGEYKSEVEEGCSKESKEKEERQKISVNPGWYGRGCRKKFKKKR